MRSRWACPLAIFVLKRCPESLGRIGHVRALTPHGCHDTRTCDRKCWRSKESEALLTVPYASLRVGLVVLLVVFLTEIVVCAPESILFGSKGWNEGVTLSIDAQQSQQHRRDRNRQDGPATPKRAAPSNTEPKATAGWTSTALALMRGSKVRFSTCWYRIPQASAMTPIHGFGLRRPTRTGRMIAMYVPMVGTNWATRPVQMPRPTIPAFR